MTYEIITLGQGEMLAGLFQAIAACINAQTGSLYTALIRLGMLTGILWSALAMLYGEYTRILQQWLLPALLIFHIGLVPATRVMIIDPITHTHHGIDHIPYGLALFSGTLSQLGSKLTQAIEKVFALPDDLQYHKTGLLFGSYLVQQARTFQLTNLEFIENLHQFVGECVTHDLLLGKYTRHELQHHPNLWQLVTAQPSPLRMFRWQRLQAASGCRRDPSEIITCREGVKRFHQAWDPEMQTSLHTFRRRFVGSVEEQVLTALPMAYSVLGQFSQSASEILKQHAMISTLVEGLEHQSTRLGNTKYFTAQQAALQQRSLHTIQGALAPQVLHSMRTVLEALAYVAFLFLVPLAILPTGYRFIQYWINLLLWLQMWGPLYAVLNYIMTLTAIQKSGSALSISNGAGLTLANSLSLAEANADVSAMAGYLAMSIPFLCIAMVKGVGSFVSLATNLSSASQSAAVSAVTEAIRGNYSFGNLSGDGVHIQQMSGWQHSYGSQYHSASHTASDGHTSLMRVSTGLPVAHIADSKLPIHFNIAKSFHTQAEKQWHQADTQAQSFTESVAIQQMQGISQTLELNDRIAHSQQSMDQHSRSQSVENSQGIAQLTRLYEQFAEENHINRHTAANFLVSAHALGIKGFRWIEGRLGGEAMNHTATRQDTYKKAVDVANSEEYQTALRLAQQDLHSLSQQAHDEATQQLAQSAHQHWSQSESLSQAAESSYRTAREYQKRAAYAEQHAIQLNQDHSQRFFEFVAEQVGAQQATTLARDPEQVAIYSQAYLRHHPLASPPETRYVTPVPTEPTLIPPPLSIQQPPSSIERSHRKAVIPPFGETRGNQAFSSAEQEAFQRLDAKKRDLQQAYAQKQQEYQQKSTESLVWQAAIKGPLRYLAHEGKAVLQTVWHPMKKMSQWVIRAEQSLIDPNAPNPREASNRQSIKEDKQ